MMSQASSWSTESRLPSMRPSSAGQRARSRGPFHPLLGEPRMRSRLLRIVPADTLSFFTLTGRLGEHDPDLLACRLQRVRRGVRLNLDGGFAGRSRSGRARATLVVQAHVEFQCPGLLAAGRGVDTGDLEQAQRIHPRD